MKKVTFTCGHTHEVEDSVKAMAGMIMEICPRCLSVKTVDDLFIGYPLSYYTGKGRQIVATKITEITSSHVTIATSRKNAIEQEQWTVDKSAIHPKGQLLVADPFGVAGGK